MTTLTNTQFADQLIDLLATAGVTFTNEAGAKSALEALLPQWNDGSVSRTVLAQSMTEFIADQTIWQGQILAWWTGTATGGDGHGNYPFTDQYGVTTNQPCPAALAAGMARGYPAKNDLTFYFQGAFRDNELCGVFMAPDAMSFVSTAEAVANTGPNASAALRFTKNGTFANPAAATPSEITAALWATATFAAPGTAGQPSAGTVTFAGASTLAQGDVVRVWAPHPQDPYLADVSVSFGGA